MVDSNETPHDKFLRLAPVRLERAVKRIKALGALTGSGYKWEVTEAQKILDDLYHAVQDVQTKFEKKSRGHYYNVHL